MVFIGLSIKFTIRIVDAAYLLYSFVVTFCHFSNNLVAESGYRSY